MKLQTQIIETDIDFEIGKINVLEFEELNVFRRFIYSLNQYRYEGKADEEIMIIKNQKQLDIKESCLILMDFYNIDFHSQPIIKKILKDLEEEYKNQEDVQNLLQEVNEKIEYFTQRLLLDYPIDLVSKKLNIRDYLKVLSIRPDSSLYKAPFEKVSFLIKLIHELKLYELIVLVDLKKYCNDKQLLEIYKLTLYLDVKVLLVESSSIKGLLKYEKKILIEEDFCEYIIENS